MNIIVGEENVRRFDGRYLTLELDSFRLPEKSDPIKFYALIDSLTFFDMGQVDEHRKLHENLIENYRSKNWESCEAAIDQLMGKWNGVLDSFYEDMSERIVELKITGAGDDWDGTITKV
jgi:hypothetical protein